VKYLIALVVMLAPLAAQAQLLKCVGKDGKVEYASACPSGSKEQQTGIRNTKEGPAAGAPAAPAAKGATGPKSTAEKEADFKKRQVEKGEAAAKEEKEAAEKAQKARACTEARGYLAGLQSGARITRTNPTTGERTFLEDNERTQEVARAQQSVDANCK
jgi:uncharacterized protein DUF4124